MKGKQKMKGINQKGFGHHLLIIIVAVLAVGAAAFAGWKIYSAKKLDAQAASWSVLKYDSNVTVYGCKIEKDTTWLFRTFAVNRNSISSKRNAIWETAVVLNYTNFGTTGKKSVRAGKSSSISSISVARSSNDSYLNMSAGIMLPGDSTLDFKRTSISNLRSC